MSVKLDISNAIVEVAEKAMKVGMSSDVVAQITGLSVEKIQENVDAMKDK